MRALCLVSCDSAVAKGLPMFVRAKGKEPYRYLQIVENHREGKRTVQRVLCTLGRVDELTSNGATDILLRSLARFAQQVNLVEGYQTGQLEAGSIRQLGPNLVFGRLWQSMGIQAVLTDLLQTRRFRFPVERAVYLTVLHRLFESGLDRAAERWRRDVHIPGSAEIELHHLFHQRCSLIARPCAHDYGQPRTTADLVISSSPISHVLQRSFRVFCVFRGSARPAISPICSPGGRLPCLAGGGGPALLREVRCGFCRPVDRPSGR